MRHPVILIILDGFGIGEKNQSNPIRAANMPTFSYLNNSFPNCALQASGIAVGLPWNEEGNSEVGHLTIGSGRIIYQHYPKITLAIQDGTFYANPAILGIFQHGQKFQSDIHILGLLSEANVHSSYSHLLAIIKIAKDYFAQNPGFQSKVCLHIFADGRDSPPSDGFKVAQKLQSDLNEFGIGEITTVSGRYWAMDRDRQWERIEPLYRLLTEPQNQEGATMEELYKKYYDRRVSDEFIEPAIIKSEKQNSELETGRPIIKDNDALFFFNFREDSIKELFQLFADPSFNKFETKKISNLYIASMTQYIKKTNTPVAFSPEEINNTLGEVLSQNNLNQLRVAESEKYAHLTLFFNAYKDNPFPNEQRILIPSIHPPSLVLERPEMRANEITERIIQALNDQAYDFIAANYANTDVLGHAANWDAAIKTLEIIDSCVKRVIDEGLKYNADIIITSDHGNIERIMNPRTGEPETQHDISLVPCFLISNKFKGKKFSVAQTPSFNPLRTEKMAAGILSDIAPTILDFLGVQKPKEMTGESLTKKMMLS